jgi:hypothetical protein
MAAQPAPAGSTVGELLTGDLGVVVVRALLENGVGYVVSSWRDRPTPIDAAIDDARERVLQPHGVLLRRLRSLRALEPIVTAPSAGITGAPPRGAVIFAGQHGLRPALEQFVTLQASGAVVGICFDVDAVRIEDAIVIDPEPTAVGIVRALDAAFVASRASGRPALVVLRPRALGLRGTIRKRATLAPKAAAQLDAAWRTEHELLDVSAAAESADLVIAERGRDTGDAGRRVLVVSGPMHRAAERALAELAMRLPAGSDRDIAESVSLVALRAVGLVPAIEGPAGQLVADATRVAVLAQRAERLAERLRDAGVGGQLHACAVDPGTVRGELVVAKLAAWLAEDQDISDEARELLVKLAEAPVAGARAGLVRTRQRVPRRSEVLHRSVSPSIAAGLALAQGVVGVPSRVDVNYPTYRTDTGVPLSVVPAAVFAAHGADSAAPGVGAGVFLVVGQAAGVAEATGAMGGSIEFVDGTSPRAIGAAIGRACRATRVANHVIVATEVQRVAAPRSSTFGMDPDLVGTERLATSAVPPAATALVDLGDELLAGPAVLALDHPDAHGALDPLRELSPATWDLRRGRTSSRASRSAWNLRRRLVRASAGVDL